MKSYDYTLTNTSTGEFSEGQIICKSDDAARIQLHREAAGKFNKVEIYHLHSGEAVFTDYIDHNGAFVMTELITKKATDPMTPGYYGYV